MHSAGDLGQLVLHRSAHTTTPAAAVKARAATLPVPELSGTVVVFAAPASPAVFSPASAAALVVAAACLLVGLSAVAATVDDAGLSVAALADMALIVA